MYCSFPSLFEKNMAFVSLFNIPDDNRKSDSVLSLFIACVVF